MLLFTNFAVNICEKLFKSWKETFCPSVIWPKVKIPVVCERNTCIYDIQFGVCFIESLG